MKKSFCTKALSLLMSLILICSSFVGITALAAENDSAPIIKVHGFMASTVYSNVGTDEQKEVFAPTAQEVIDAILTACPDLIMFAATRDFDALGDAIIPALNSLFSDAFGNSNGELVEGTGIDWQYPTEDSVRSSKTTNFTYDWRLPPLVIAEQLHDYIKYVEKCTGSSKVSLICHSFGNCVGMAYVAKYGTDDLEGFVSNASAFFGETFNGELMTGKLQINGDSLCSYLNENVFQGTEYEQIGAVLSEILKLLNVVDTVADSANYMIPYIQERAARELLLQWFGKWPCIWAMVPDEYYEEGRAYVFDGVLADEDCSGLLRQLDEYDAVVREHKAEILNSVADSTRFGVIAKYNVQKLPITDNPNALTDNNVDVCYASYGATAADYGSTLPEGYTQARYTEFNYISPDNMIDASTCMFPERTWFIKNMSHSEDCDQLDALIDNILSQDGFTVMSDADFPQFMIYDIQSDSIAELNDSTERQTSSTLKFFNILQMLKKLLMNLLRAVGVTI